MVLLSAAGFSMSLFFGRMYLKFVPVDGIIGCCWFFNVTFLWGDIVEICSNRWHYWVLQVL